MSSARPTSTKEETVRIVEGGGLRPESTASSGCGVAMRMEVPMYGVLRRARRARNEIFHLSVGPDASQKRRKAGAKGGSKSTRM